MPASCSFDELIQLLRSRDQDAASVFFNRYAQRLIEFARTHLDQRLKGKVDPEDVVQSVFRSFFGRVGASGWPLQSEDGLWAILVVMTARKCGRTAKRLLALKRGGGVPHVEVGTTGDEAGPTWDPVAADPSPEETAMLIETMETLAAGLDARQRKILELSLQQYSVPEISEKIKRTTRTVYRALDHIRTRLDEMRRRDLDE